MTDLDEALDALQEVLDQVCAGVDSACLSAYSYGFRVLAKHGMFEIEKDSGGLVTGKMVWVEPDNEYRSEYCNGCVMKNKLLPCAPYTNSCAERRKINDAS